MTTIASTSYSTSASYFSAKDKAGSANADGEFTGQSAQNIRADRRNLAISDGSTSATDSRPSKVIVIVDGKVLTGNVIDVSKLEVDTTKLSDAEYKSLIEGRRQSIEADKQYLERQYTKYADISNEPKLKPYATITAGGRTVATIDNQGVVTTYGGISDGLLDQLPDSINGTNGPDLAQARAEAIASMIGGRVQKSSSAISQRQFNLLPPIEEAVGTVDYAAMKNDPLYQIIHNAQSFIDTTEQKRAASLGQH
ncbi:hypothetical protein [Rhizobium lusitanum]|uniref:Uncharacterized protein n=1 Tax=Rhizobium lusitanum TaxID=293958 RepID=A0A7X0IXG3_9HYPH|nr:hypothetical protein [Rhizobium lusitanum]MBB6487727.1 hypothetical protein [Rhizobium lusitanum]